MSQRGDEEQRERETWRRGRQTVWFKEEGEEKETYLGLRLGEEGADREEE